ncbi:unnamed protein product [Amoebophrya sp. A120]|nr:unnamed protein product [Amoebophrya sp. A120]|eukprot:GSA120T00018082001.1
MLAGAWIYVRTQMTFEDQDATRDRASLMRSPYTGRERVKPLLNYATHYVAPSWLVQSRNYTTTATSASSTSSGGAGTTTETASDVLVPGAYSYLLPPRAARTTGADILYAREIGIRTMAAAKTLSSPRWFRKYPIGSGKQNYACGGTVGTVVKALAATANTAESCRAEVDEDRECGAVLTYGILPVTDGSGLSFYCHCVKRGQICEEEERGTTPGARVQHSLEIHADLARSFFFPHFPSLGGTVATDFRASHEHAFDFVTGANLFSPDADVFLQMKVNDKTIRSGDFARGGVDADARPCEGLTPAFGGQYWVCHG